MSECFPLHPGSPCRGLLQAAGVHDLAEARAVAVAGFQLLGLPLRLPVHTPDLSEKAAAALVASLPASLTPVCITYETEPDALLHLLRTLGTRHVQLHASQGTEADVALLRELKRRAPDLCIIKSCIVGLGNEEALVEQVRACADYADAFITDTYDPSSGATGATGLPHDWNVSRRLAALSPRPLILAGGLHPGNVARAVRAVRPAGVDAHTGLEDADGRKDSMKLQEFVREASKAFGEIEGGE